MSATRDHLPCDKHHCHARMCNAHVRPEMLMCRKHWFMVPKPLRDRVWATYNPGQCDGDAPVTEAWHAAADAAIKAVYERELARATGGGR